MSTASTKFNRDEAADAPTWRVAIAAILVHGTMAGWIVHDGLISGQILGIPWGEQWGRLFVTAQVSRWFTGVRPGWADLLSAPDGRPFWPVDPLVQAAQVPASALFGEGVGWALVVALLSFVAGCSGTILARRAGADGWRAVVVGLLLQLNPFWLREGAEGVTEALAIGYLALAATAAWRASESASRAAIGLFALAWLAVCWTSPYHAIYGVGAALLAYPLWPDRRTGAILVTVAVCVGIIAALPLVIAEWGAHGRLADTWRGGYRLVPDELVKISHEAGALVIEPARQSGFGIGGGNRGRGEVAMISRFFVPWPGGFPVAVLLAVGLWRPQTRKIALFGSLFFLFGPAWGPIVRAVGLPELASPLEAVLSRLPLTNLLGNVNRSVAVPMLIAAYIAGTDRNRLGTMALAVGVITAAWLELPGLALPATTTSVPRGLFPSISGPTAVFPSGDPPLWNPGPWPKENLWLAGIHGGAQGYDYGRGSEPLDANLQVRLSEVAGVPLGRGAAERHQVSDSAIWADLHAHGFERILVLRRTLEDPAWEAAHAYVTEHAGPPLVMTNDGAVWAVP